MASLYKNNGIWYIAVSHNGPRKCRSLKTKDRFNSIVRFEYYTGARSGEIRSLSRDCVLEDSLIVRGKTGRRMVKLNNQAKELINYLYYVQTFNLGV